MTSEMSDGRALDRAPSQVWEAASFDATAQASDGSLSILIVDDDPIFRYSVQRMLMAGNPGHRIDVADNAFEAIARIEQ